MSAFVKLWLMIPVCSLYAVGGTAWAQGNSDSLPAAPAISARPQVPDGLKPIAAPADPARVRATYTMGGAEVSVTEQQFYDAYLLLKPHEERKEQPLQPMRIIEHLLMFAEAQALGLAPSLEEVALSSPLRAGAMFAESMRERLKSMGITDAQYHDYLRQTRASQRLKDWSTNDIRVRSSAAFEQWKAENHLFRVAFVEFPATQLEKDLMTKGASETELRKFWSENVNAQNKHRLPTTVSADLLLFDPENLTAAQKAALHTAGNIGREQAFAHFKKHKERLMQQIPSDQRPKLYPAAGQLPKIQDIVTPFDVLLPVIQRELVLGDPMGAAFEKARVAGATADLAALAKEFGLQHVRIEKQDNLALSKLLPAAGHQLFSELFNAPPGQVSNSLAWSGATQYFWRAVDKSVSALPSFEEVGAKLVQDWAHESAVLAAQKGCLDFLAALENAVGAETGSEEAQIDEDARAAAAKEIATLSAENREQTEMIRQKHNIFGENKKRTLRATRMAAHFEAVAQTRALKLAELPPFAFETMYTDRGSITDPAELRASFLRSSYQIRGLEPGQVSPILSDVVLGSHFVVKLISREEPPFENMPAADFAQRSSGLERQEVYSAMYRWSAQQLMQRHGWTEF